MFIQRYSYIPHKIITFVFFSLIYFTLVLTILLSINRRAFYNLMVLFFIYSLLIFLWMEAWVEDTYYEELYLIILLFVLYMMYYVRYNNYISQKPNLNKYIYI